MGPRFCNMKCLGWAGTVSKPGLPGLTVVCHPLVVGAVKSWIIYIPCFWILDLKKDSGSQAGLNFWENGSDLEDSSGLLAPISLSNYLETLETWRLVLSLHTSWKQVIIWPTSPHHPPPLAITNLLSASINSTLFIRVRYISEITQCFSCFHLT